jgi:hypothetical protein
MLRQSIENMRTNPEISNVLQIAPAKEADDISDESTIDPSSREFDEFSVGGHLLRSWSSLS